MDSPVASSKVKNYISNFLPVNALSTQVFNFTTHIGTNNNNFALSSKAPSRSYFNYQLPITSLYERTGHFSVLEGLIRKQNKSVSSVGASRSLETILSVFCRRQGVTI